MFICLRVIDFSTLKFYFWFQEILIHYYISGTELDPCDVEVGEIDDENEEHKPVSADQLLAVSSTTLWFQHSHPFYTLILIWMG